MTKGICIIILFLGIIGCESDKKHSSEPDQNNTYQNVNRVDTSKSKIMLNVPFGNPMVITFEFDSAWQFRNWSGRDILLLDTINQSAFIELYRSSQHIKGFDSKKITRSYIENNSYLHYYNPLYHAFDSTMAGRGIYVPQETFLKNQVELVLYSCPKIRPGKNVREYDYYYSRSDLISYDEQGNEIHGMPVSFIAGTPISKYSRFFYIDSNFIINTIDFYGDEEEVKIVRREKWQILEDGYFVRFFDKPFENYRNQEEYGEVRNNTKEGKWIEIKPRGIKRKRYESLTFVEANYSNGKPDGKWYFYELTYEYDKVFANIYGGDSIGSLSEIPGSEKKGNLIYSEEHKDGKLIQRIFPNEKTPANKK